MHESTIPSVLFASTTAKKVRRTLSTKNGGKPLTGRDAIAATYCFLEHYHGKPPSSASVLRLARDQGARFDNTVAREWIRELVAQRDRSAKSVRVQRDRRAPAAASQRANSAKFVLQQRDRSKLRAQPRPRAENSLSSSLPGTSLDNIYISREEKKRPDGPDRRAVVRTPCPEALRYLEPDLEAFVARAAERRSLDPAAVDRYRCEVFDAVQRATDPLLYGLAIQEAHARGAWSLKYADRVFETRSAPARPGFFPASGRTTYTPPPVSNSRSFDPYAQGCGYNGPRATSASEPLVPAIADPRIAEECLAKMRAAYGRGASRAKSA